MKKVLQIMLATVALTVGLFGTGCASTPPADGANTGPGPGVQAGAIAAEIIAKDATIIALGQHPEWRAGFERAEGDLTVLAAAEKIDLAAVAAIITRLPVKELKGKEAQMIIGDTQIIIKHFAPNEGTIVSEERYAGARLIIRALRDGIRQGLDGSL